MNWIVVDVQAGTGSWVDHDADPTLDIVPIPGVDNVFLVRVLYLHVFRAGVRLALGLRTRVGVRFTLRALVCVIFITTTLVGIGAAVSVILIAGIRNVVRSGAGAWDVVITGTRGLNLDIFVACVRHGFSVPPIMNGALTAFALFLGGFPSGRMDSGDLAGNGPTFFVDGPILFDMDGLSPVHIGDHKSLYMGLEEEVVDPEAEEAEKGDCQNSATDFETVFQVLVGLKAVIVTIVLI